MDPNGTTKREFERHYREWRDLIESTPRLRYSSKTTDFMDNEPFRRLVALGLPALPFIMAKVRDGDFFLNNAVFEITGLTTADVVPDADETYPQQEIAQFLVEWWDRQTSSP